ncbi:hypothetical protein B5F75_04130 [Candidatus Avelusimicrobium gallicola]|uniref:Uncharacterized protein n=1 Tax=Candidatus Avelusimicrobium gallicola TaxID=2562704 RepID=A0A1Y4DEH8_9BACT|nr:hypothetical protein B5F75_04130 [Elusimicrobium sp. An273]
MGKLVLKRGLLKGRVFLSAAEFNGVLVAFSIDKKHLFCYNNFIIKRTVRFVIFLSGASARFPLFFFRFWPCLFVQAWLSCRLLTKEFLCLPKPVPAR